MTSGTTILRKNDTCFAEEPGKSQQREALMPGMQGWLRGVPLVVVQDLSPLLCPSEKQQWALAVSLSLQQPRLARVGTAAQQGLNSRRAPSTRAQHLSSALPPQLWDPRIPSSARGNSGQKRGTQSVGGTFPVPVNKNKPSKGLVIGIQATQKAGTSKLEHIPNISLEVQLTECFQ